MLFDSLGQALKLNEVGSNEEGVYIKFDNGIMICLIEKDLGFLNFSTAWGSMYELAQSIDLGYYPKKFINNPKISVTVVDGPGIVECIENRTNVKIGTINLMRPNPNASAYIKLHIIAVGNWK